LASKNATVHLVCRSEERGKAALEAIKSKTGNNDVFLHICDMAEEEDVRKFASTVTSIVSTKGIYCLVNNAGVMLKDRSVSKTGKETTLITMVNGTHLLTSLLVKPLALGAPSRVIDISSGGMYTYGLDVDDLSGERGGYDGTRAYTAAKRAQVILSEMWAAKLAPLKIHVNSMHPGWSLTPGLSTAMKGFVQQQGETLRSIEEGADSIVWMACSPEAEGLTGKVMYLSTLTFHSLF
jgi:dehydrogenase/reductase SDR family protein 12